MSFPQLTQIPFGIMVTPQGQTIMKKNTDQTTKTGDQWTYNDGGRAQAGYKGHTGDCVCRAIAIANGLSYKEVYDMIIERAKKERLTKRMRGRSHPRTGVHRGIYQSILEQLGWTWKATMKIGSGCKVHLKADELPRGTIICRVTKHVTVMNDGVIHDTYNCSRDGTRCVYGYFYKEGQPAPKAPTKQERTVIKKESATTRIQRSQKTTGKLTPLYDDSQRIERYWIELKEGYLSEGGCTFLQEETIAEVEDQLKYIRKIPTPLEDMTFGEKEWDVLCDRLSVPCAIAECLTDHAEGDEPELPDHSQSEILERAWELGRDRNKTLNMADKLDETIIREAFAGSTFYPFTPTERAAVKRLETKLDQYFPNH